MRVSFFCVLLSCVVVLCSCASPNIGREVISSQVFCKKEVGTCSGVVGNFYISYTIEKIGDEYEVRGTAKNQREKSMSWNRYTSAMFSIYLINKSKIVDEIKAAGGDGDLDSVITFSRRFKSDGFDYSTIEYHMNVRG